VELASSMDTTEHVEVELSLEPQSAARARAAIAPLRAQAERSSFDDVRLMVSELVADALATGSRPSNGAIVVEAQVLDGVTRVNVRFDHVALRLPERKPAPAEAGWGVYLVQTLATRWGARRTNGSTYVWFEA
jgi:anti-sigma regulatory factor (Ser/Thr protein kinase)